MKVVAIIQARMGSTRLPGKALLDLAGEPMLARVVTRTARAATVDEVWVATTVEPADDAIAELCASRGWSCWRGSQDDVLDRYYQAAQQAAADVVVRITSDCPLIDPQLVDRCVRTFCEGQPEVDYVSNDLPRCTFPRGLDTEVFRFDVLQRAWREGRDAVCREHVTPYIWRNPLLFRLAGVSNEPDYSAMRWTVDTPQDFALVTRVYEHFAHDRFAWREVLTLVEEHPDWQELNRGVRQKEV